MCEREDRAHARNCSTLGPVAKEAQTGLRMPVGVMCKVKRESATKLWSVKSEKEPSTTPGAIVRARSTENERCPPLSTALTRIHPFRRRADAPRARLSERRIVKDGTDEMAVPYYGMLRSTNVCDMGANSELSSPRDKAS